MSKWLTSSGSPMCLANKELQWPNNILTHWPLAFFKKIILDQFLSTYLTHSLLNYSGMDANNLKLTLVQVIAWCHQAPSHYLSQFRLRLCCHMPSLGHNEFEFFENMATGSKEYIVAHFLERKYLYFKLNLNWVSLIHFLLLIFFKYWVLYSW